MCFWYDNMATEDIDVIVAEIKKRKRQKNLYSDKKIVKSKTEFCELPLFAINQINPKGIKNHGTQS